MYEKIRDLLKKNWLYLLFPLIFIVFFLSEMSNRSEQYLHDGQLAMIEKKSVAGIAMFERSALTYVPFSSAPRKAIEELKKIRNSKLGEDMRYAELADHALLRIKRQLYPASPGNLDFELPTDLIRGGGLSLTHRLAIHISFFLCIGGIFWFIWKGFTPEGRFDKLEASNGLFTFATSLLIWLFLLAV
jgi:hypothetical protein